MKAVVLKNHFGSTAARAVLVNKIVPQIEVFGGIVLNHSVGGINPQAVVAMHRIGGKYPDAWHYHHMRDPASMSPGSIMPPYPWLLTDQLDISNTSDKLGALQKVGVPYDDQTIGAANADLQQQAKLISGHLAKDGIRVEPDREIVALIAYLQRMGTDIKKMETAAE